MIPSNELSIKDVAKVIVQKHQYYITPIYWSRLGKMCSRYGTDTVLNKINSANEDYENLSHLFGAVEKACQDSLTDFEQFGKSLL
jgi:hypothetical protein